MGEGADGRWSGRAAEVGALRAASRSRPDTGARAAPARRLPGCREAAGRRLPRSLPLAAAALDRVVPRTLTHLPATRSRRTPIEATRLHGERFEIDPDASGITVLSPLILRKEGLTVPEEGVACQQIRWKPSMMVAGSSPAADSKDPRAPGVLLYQESGGRQYLVVANCGNTSAESPDALTSCYDGCGIVLEVDDVAVGHFRGRWGPWGIVVDGCGTYEARSSR